MLDRPSIELDQQDKSISADEPKNGSQENSVPLTILPDEILLCGINRYCLVRILRV